MYLHVKVLSHQQGPVSIYDKTFYCKISWSLEAARFVFEIVRSLWNLTGTSAALLPKCLSNFKAMRYFKLPLSRLQVFARSYDKTSYRLLRRGPGHEKVRQLSFIIYCLLIVSIRNFHDEVTENDWRGHVTTHITIMTSSNGNIFRVTGHLCREFTGPRWIPCTKASDAELWCFLWSASE